MAPKQMGHAPRPRDDNRLRRQALRTNRAPQPRQVAGPPRSLDYAVCRTGAMWELLASDAGAITQSKALRPWIPGACCERFDNGLSTRFEAYPVDSSQRDKPPRFNGVGHVPSALDFDFVAQAKL